MAAWRGLKGCPEEEGRGILGGDQHLQRPKGKASAWISGLGAGHKPTYQAPLTLLAIVELHTLWSSSWGSRL